MSRAKRRTAGRYFVGSAFQVLRSSKRAVFAQAAEFDFGLGRVGDAGGLEEGDGLAVDGGAHGAAYGLAGE
jgi:hypothetical protein